MSERAAELTAYCTAHWTEICRRERIVFFVDECFLRWGDACGYVWGRRGEQTELPVDNPHTRQPYYGAVDMLTGRVELVPYDVADACATTDFLLDLHLRYPEAKLTIIWDNARHHTAQAVAAYLAEVNAALPAEAWPITCLWFAPHDPSQNPIEEVWKQAKTFVRQQWAKLTSFLDVTTMFEQFRAEHVFDFPKLHRYCPDLQGI